MSNYAKIKTFDCANGKGIRTSIFFSGCQHHCDDCFNQELWNYNYGIPFTETVYHHQIKSTIQEHISGISILGGEPLDIKNIEDALMLCRKFKKDFPNKTIWIWTGYTWEELMSRSGHELNNIKDILNLCDVLVDGKFIKEKKDMNLYYRGSSNQRVIDVPASLSQDKVVLYEE